MIRDRRGVAVIEFALVAPLLVAMCLGLPELVRYVRTRTLFYVATSNLAEMVSSQAGVTSGSGGTMVDYCTGVQMTLTPFPNGNLTVAIASVTNTASVVSRDWEYDAACPSVSPGLGRAAAVAAAAGMVPNSGDSVIVVQSSFTYVPNIKGIIAPVTFTQTTLTRPRRSVVLCSVASSNGSACPSVP